MYRFFILGFLTSSAAFAQQAEPREKPNIIVIMADDLGYGDLSCYGAKRIQTPHIDRFAQEGLRFTQGYSATSSCTSSRFAFLTGKYAFRQSIPAILAPNGAALIQPGTTNLASILQQAGYQTTVIGKWHLGFGAAAKPDWNGELKPGPLDIGFHSCFLLPTSPERVPSVYVENHRVANLDPQDPLAVEDSDLEHPGASLAITQRSELRVDWSQGHNDSIHNDVGRIGTCKGGAKARWNDEDLTKQWATRSEQWISANKEKPFFLLLTPHNVHAPRLPSKEFQGKSPLGARGDSILELDWLVGEIRKSLEKNGLEKKTLVIFCSDNGPILDDGYQDGAKQLNGDHTPAGPYQGEKYSSLEGGTHTPMISWWPGKIAPGISHEILCSLDFPSSLAALTEQKLPPDACPDSMNLLPALLGEKEAKGRVSLIEQGSELALRKGDWKYRDLAKNPELYHLQQDAGETKNVISQFPEIANQLKLELESIKMAGRSRPN